METRLADRLVRSSWMRRFVEGRPASRFDLACTRGFESARHTAGLSEMRMKWRSLLIPLFKMNASSSQGDQAFRRGEVAALSLTPGRHRSLNLMAPRKLLRPLTVVGWVHTKSGVILLFEGVRVPDFQCMPRMSAEGRMSRSFLGVTRRSKVECLRAMPGLP